MLSHCRKEVVMKVLCVVSLWALLCSLGNCEDDQTIALVRSMNCQKELLFKTLYTRVRVRIFFSTCTTRLQTEPRKVCCRLQYCLYSLKTCTVWLDSLVKERRIGTSFTHLFKRGLMNSFFKNLLLHVLTSLVRNLLSVKKITRGELWRFFIFKTFLR